MNVMDNDLLIKTMEKVALHCYLKKLIDSSLDKITLFKSWPQNGLANILDPVQLVMVKDLSTLIALNSGAVNN